MAPNCILLRATSKGYLMGRNTKDKSTITKSSNKPRLQLTVQLSCKQETSLPAHLRYCLSDGSGNTSTEQVDVGFQNEDIRVVWGGTSKHLRKVFQAEALQGAEGEEWKTCKVKTIKVMQQKEHRSHMSRRRFYILLQNTFTIIKLVINPSVINLCKIIITCIRGHSNKSWGKSPIEAPDTPLLYKIRNTG